MIVACGTVVARRPDPIVDSPLAAFPATPLQVSRDTIAPQVVTRQGVIPQIATLQLNAPRAVNPMVTLQGTNPVGTPLGISPVGTPWTNSVDTPQEISLAGIALETNHEVTLREVVMMGDLRKTGTSQGLPCAVIKKRTVTVAHATKTGVAPILKTAEMPAEDVTPTPTRLTLPHPLPLPPSQRLHSQHNRILTRNGSVP